MIIPALPINWFTISMIFFMTIPFRIVRFNLFTYSGVVFRSFVIYLVVPKRMDTMLNSSILLPVSAPHPRSWDSFPCSATVNFPDAVYADILDLSYVLSSLILLLCLCECQCCLFIQKHRCWRIHSKPQNFFWTSNDPHTWIINTMQEFYAATVVVWKNRIDRSYKCRIHMVFSLGLRRSNYRNIAWRKIQKRWTVLNGAVISKLRGSLILQRYQRSNNYYYNVNLWLTNSKVFIFRWFVGTVSMNSGVWCSLMIYNKEITELLEYGD